LANDISLGLKYLEKEKKLTESEERFRTLVTSSPDSVAETDLKGNLTSISDQTLKLHRYANPSELLGKSAFILIAPEDHPKAQKNLKKTLREGNIMREEYRMLRKDGTTFIGELDAALIRDNSGRPQSLIATVRDITERKRSENALRESREHYRSLFENMVEGFAHCRMLFDHGKPQDFIYLEVNKAFEKLTGLKRVIGKKVSQVIPGIQKDNPELFQIYGRVSLTGKPEKFETHIKSLDIWLSISVYSIEKEHFIAVFDNITERKKNEETLQKFKLAVAAASDHIIITDENAVILYANKAVEKITGFSQSEVVGKKAGTQKLWGGMMPQEFYERMWETIANKKKIFTGEIQNRRKNGEVYTALASISPVLGDDGNVRFFVGIERDITHEKEVDRAKTEFVSLASHQLRTPLTAINWYSEMLLSGDVGPLSEEQSRYLKEVYRGSQRMVRLVNDLLNVSRLEIGGLLVEPIPAKLDLLIADIIRESAFMETSREVPISFAKPKESTELAIDPELLRQVLRNLINNAIRYCSDDHPDAKIEIRLEKRAVEGVDSLVISIMDNGIGIPKEDQHRVFEKFFRAGNAEKTAAGGTGLGLYICKMVVKAWGGEIWFESEEGKGSTFYVTIPLTGMVSRKGEKKLV
jgi:PAS domain S-box-containing protein